MDDAVDKFAPLTLQERAAVPLARGQTEYDGEHVSPIPADAPDVRIEASIFPLNAALPAKRCRDYVMDAHRNFPRSR
jgi:hypothetical protein